MISLPDFRSEAFLRAHIAQTMDFYHPHCIDPVGGFFHYFMDNGTVYDHANRHLVSSTRFVFNYAMAAREFKRSDYLYAARHGLAYLRDVHRDPQSGAYAWTIRDGKLLESTRHAYGMAFVLLAYATALKAGIEEAAPWIDETWQLLEARFWDADAGLYRDEADADWNFSAYRGQNANMHLTEALLAAFEATNEDRYVARALAVADAMTRRQAAQAGGLVWEHYDPDWNIDWDYHRDDPKHLFRPWGFQPGHQTEWAKLLLTLDRYRPRDWLLPTATYLYETAFARSWDEINGGLCYGFAPDGSICDGDKYFWVQAESLAAVALLGERSNDARHIADYDKIWSYAWRHFVDHEYGAWYRILDQQNRKYSGQKSPAGKTDYHTMGACHDVLAMLRRSSEGIAP